MKGKVILLLVVLIFFSTSNIDGQIATCSGEGDFYYQFPSKYNVILAYCIHKGSMNVQSVSWAVKNGSSDEVEISFSKIYTFWNDATKQKETGSLFFKPGETKTSGNFQGELSLNDIFFKEDYEGNSKIKQVGYKNFAIKNISEEKKQKELEENQKKEAAKKKEIEQKNLAIKKHKEDSIQSAQNEIVKKNVNDSIAKIIQNNKYKQNKENNKNQTTQNDPNKNLNSKPSEHAVYSDPNEYVVIQGEKYKTKKIGNQTWMVEDLDIVTSSSRCTRLYDYDKDAENPQDCIDYDMRLYTFAEAKQLCPEGWRLPGRTDWLTLLKCVEPSFDIDDYYKPENNKTWLLYNQETTQVGGQKAIYELGSNGQSGFNIKYNDRGHHGTTYWIDELKSCLYFGIEEATTTSILCFFSSGGKSLEGQILWNPNVVLWDCMMTSLTKYPNNADMGYVRVRYIKN